MYKPKVMRSCCEELLEAVEEVADPDYHCSIRESVPLLQATGRGLVQLVP
jgi:hypothetical protein